jgi:hypothetical protein
MAWIPFDKDLPKKIEVVRIADITGIDRTLVWAYLLLFWAWADDQTEDGFLPRMRVRNLCEVCADVPANFWDAVVQVGWITETPEGVDIVNFDYYLGNSAKNRLKETRRKQKYRHKRDKVHPASTKRSGLARTEPGQMSRVSRDEAGTTEQNRTEQNTPLLPPSGGSEGGASEKEDPDADLPLFVSGRAPVRQVCDAPHLEPEARRVTSHYVAAVGRPAFAKGGAGLVAVMDLLAWGVRPEVLMRAADAYAAFSRLCGTPPAGPDAFFAHDGEWREYRKGPARRPEFPPPGPP